MKTDKGGESIELLDHEELHRLMEEEDWLRCENCDLHKTRQGPPVLGQGQTDDPYLVLVGQCPGAHEEVEGVPFVGRSGDLLDMYFEALGIDREWCYFTNVVKCRPTEHDDPRKNRKPYGAEVSACKDKLFQELYYLDPKMIIALGSEAAKVLGGPSCLVSKRRGDIITAKLPSRVGDYIAKDVMVTYHPSYVLRVTEGYPPLTKEDLANPKTAYAEVAHDLLFAAACREDIETRYDFEPPTELTKLVAQMRSDRYGE